jgi:hypothetical protein
MMMTPTTTTKFSERFATKVEDVRKKVSENISDSPISNLNITDTNKLQAMSDRELLTLFERVKTETTMDDLTCLQLELQLHSLLTLKAIDWKLWELYNKAGKNN